MAEHPNFAALDAAYEHVGATYSVAQLDEAVQYVEGVVRANGGRDIDPTHDGYARAVEVLERIALRMYSGDKRKAQSFASGYFLFRSGAGVDVEPSAGSDVDRDAWEQGRAHNPDYQRHKAAQVAATEAFRQRFGVPEPVTQKGHAYWRKHYCKAMGEA